MTPFKTLMLALPVAALGLPALADGHAMSPPEEIGTALGAADDAGVTQLLLDAGEVTVFVPSNDAISGAPEDALSGLLADTEQLSAVMQGYAVPGTLMAADAVAAIEGAGGTAELETVGGSTLMATVTDGTVMVGPSEDAMVSVVTPDLQFGNITIHVIDGVFLPQTDM